jgi:hypothetical protein
MKPLTALQILSFVYLSSFTYSARTTCIDPSECLVLDYCDTAGECAPCSVCCRLNNSITGSCSSCDTYVTSHSGSMHSYVDYCGQGSHLKFGNAIFGIIIGVPILLLIVIIFLGWQYKQKVQKNADETEEAPTNGPKINGFVSP